jgi:hypothetical protein
MNFGTRAAIIAASLACIAPASAWAEEFHLSCGGMSTGLGTTTTFGSVDANNGASASGSATSYYRTQSADRLVLEIDDKGAKIRVPTTLIPPLHGGGQGGWWTLTDVSVSESEISGKFSLNPINKPRLRVDRRTGDIAISGLGATGFRGTCERFEPAPEARKF